ncbi:hypothetical protein O6H91_19G012200 [Diphasiastrum complanatum]|uniref:Uncharacterized protein n=1 Tax=Diphasiastrum complanatum TaxID=34168 RepID=A0ACC2ASY4_DIPCM|nr:hypothetical protein O6H91_19G012200 [Diphasiastrum complanatum]
MADETVSSLEDPDVEASLRKAVQARAGFIREQAESMTLERLRRLLEEDLGKKAHQLDGCKRLIKHLVDEVLNNPEETEALNDVVGDMEDDTLQNIDEEENKEEIENLEGQSKAGNLKKHEVKEDEKSPNDDSDNLEKASIVEQKYDETSVRKAILKRASYLRAQSESITLQQVRRLLETDLGLQEFQLDKQKQLVKKLVDEVLHTSEETPKKPRKEKKQRENSKAPTNGEKKSISKKKRAKKDVMLGLRIESTRSKLDEDVGEEKSSESDEGNHNEEFIEKKHKGSLKKSGEVKLAHSKFIERLRQTIKACGLSVPPHVYRKAKQAPEQERDQVLEKELEAILDREGLSVNASEKEIKAARKRRERQKDLEDIDTKNIIMEPRGRRQASLFFSPVYKAPEENKEPSDEEDVNATSSNEDESSPVEEDLIDDSD